MFKIAICDSDSFICEEIKKTIVGFSKNSNIKITIEHFYEGDSLLTFLKYQHSFDLIFLNTKLPTITGIEIAHILRYELDDHTTNIVFLSSGKECYPLLFEVQPMNLLQKPVLPEHIVNSINIALQISMQNKYIFQYKVGYEFRCIQTRDILYFEKNLRKVKIITLNDSDEFYGTLEGLRVQLPSTFFIPHASYIVNRYYVRKISGGKIFMENSDTLPISKRNHRKFYTAL